MYSSIQFKMWRVINSILLAIGMLLPWYELMSIEGDVFVMPAGWKATYDGVVWILGYIKLSGFDWYFIVLILAGIGVVLATLYMVYNLFAAIQERNMRCKLISFVFVGMVVLFLLESTGGATRPVMGLGVISLGLLSSAALEWMNARSADTQPLSQPKISF